MTWQEGIFEIAKTIGNGLIKYWWIIAIVIITPIIFYGIKKITP